MIFYGDKQKFYLTNANSRWNIAIGATRSGKSHIQLHIIPRRIRENIPGIYLLIAKTLGNIESNILAPMRLMYGDRYVSHPRLRHGLQQATIFGKDFLLIGGDNIRSVDKLRGKSVGYCAGDEAPTWPYELFQMLKTRITNDHARVDLTGNPEGPYHWFKRDLIDRQDIVDVFHLPFGLDDNPTLSEKAKNTLRAELTGVWYQRLILGEWAAAEGAIYDMFDRDVHTCQPESIPELQNYILGVDWGMDHPTAGCMFGWNHPKMVYQVGEFFYRHRAGSRRKTSSEIVAGISDQFINTQPKTTYYDPSALVLKTEMEAHNLLLKQGKKNGIIFNVRRARNDVLDGINHYSNMLNHGYLKISTVCRNTIKQNSSYSWDQKAQQRGIDQPLKIDDDFPDAGRYGLFTEFGRSGIIGGARQIK